MYSVLYKKRIGTIHLIIALILFIVGILIFSIMEYKLHEERVYNQIDEKLKIASFMTDTLLTHEFHDRAIDENSISDEEYTSNIKRLSELAKILDVIYIYTMVEKNGQIYFTASNATDEEIQTGINLTTYFERYEDPSEGLKKVFKTNNTDYDEYTDKWGTFRSIFLPMKSPNGNLYVIAADIQIDVLKQHLQEEMLHLTLRFFVTFIFALPLVIMYFRKINEEKIHYLSYFDTLTKLPNKIHLESYVSYVINLAQRNQKKFAVLLVDIDHFKSINDSLGHYSGDMVLIETAKRLKTLIRDSDIIARFNADQFVIICAINDISGAQKIAEKILSAINKPYIINDFSYNFTASIGIATYPLDGFDFGMLFKNADTALHRVKLNGCDHYCFVTTEMQEKSAKYLSLSSALHNALNNNELYLVYQPQVSLTTCEITGVEALIRWKHPDLGNIPPTEFIPIAEDNGLILPIGEWVLKTAITQAAIWNKSLKAPILMAINLSSIQFRHPSFIENVMQVLDETGLDSSYLEFELTESVAMHDTQSVIKIIDTLFGKGIKISIDDFGTGYSSLSYLKQFKIHKLKIDQSFIRDIATNGDDRAITSAIISMAHTLGFKTIAEGVETQEQLLFLRDQGCDEIQGYFYSQPLIKEDFEHFIETFKL